MQIDSSSVSALSLLNRANRAADALDLPVIVQDQSNPDGSTAGSSAPPAAPIDAPIDAPRGAILVGSEGLSLLQAPNSQARETRAGNGPPSSKDEEEPAKKSANDDEATGEKQAVGGEEEGPDGLTDSQRQEVQQLQRIDAEVRRHEQAHASAGGIHAGSPTYQYQRGPDGRLYAVGGEVRINAGPVPGNPEATISKMRQVRRAALAPATPSSQDLRIAAAAQTEIAKAQAEVRQERLEERRERDEDSALTAQGVPDAGGPEEAPALGADPTQESLSDGSLTDNSPDRAQRELLAQRAFGGPQEARGDAERSRTQPIDIVV